jgi:hypothetical protein
MQNPMSLKDADLSQHQRWILEQVCRTFRVPLPMVQDLTHGTYTNSEQADLWLSKYTATPIAKNTEGVIRRKLFLPSERDTYYAKFNVNAMMRGDFAARTAGYSVLINSGVLAPNEARALEDWNPYEGGDEFRVPLSTTPAGDASQTERTKYETLALLIRSGFTAESAIAALGLPDIEYDNVQPVTVRPVGEDGVQLAPADPNATEAPAPTENAIAALAPLIGDAKERISARHKQNLERGRTEQDSLDFALLVLEPIVSAAKTLGVFLNAEEVAREIIEKSDEPKNVTIEVPAYVAENAARGLAYYEDGLAGDGLVEQTIRDARALASGAVSDRKVRLMGPWIARHLVDLDAPKNSDPEDPEYPGAGLVAMLLWGAGPDKAGAERTLEWANREIENLEEQ